MGLVEMVAIVAALSQLIKDWTKKVIEFKGGLAVLLTLVVSAGVVGYKYLTEHTPFDVGAYIALVVQVFLGANAGYKFLKVASGKKK